MAFVEGVMGNPAFRMKACSRCGTHREPEVVRLLPQNGRVRVEGQDQRLCPGCFREHIEDASRAAKKWQEATTGDPRFELYGRAAFGVLGILSCAAVLYVMLGYEGGMRGYHYFSPVLARFAPLTAMGLVGSADAKLGVVGAVVVALVVLVGTFFDLLAMGNLN